ncbi:MAG: hypothetical protein DDT42_01501 [candidate division WS2 bacterium]|uniref:Uncharacterized protein n=1 Tax=Psychracetigena formicireducens TaxID=2986056 RepID=A0A9E2BIQ7_PSYF1|nr:hypothetical protein [Candidatus Psychracetigena formicireducens]
MFIAFLITAGLMFVSLFIFVVATYSGFFLPLVDYIIVAGVIVFIVGYILEEIKCFKERRKGG